MPGRSPGPAGVAACGLDGTQARERFSVTCRDPAADPALDLRNLPQVPAGSQRVNVGIIQYTINLRIPGSAHDLMLGLQATGTTLEAPAAARPMEPTLAWDPPA